MRRWFIWGLPAVILLGLVAWRFAGRSLSGQDDQKGSSGRATEVRVTPAASRFIVETAQSVGNVESPYKIEISPKSSGRINYLQVREGDKVTVGQVLVRIDPSDLNGAVIQQKANVAEARARLAQARLGQGSVTVGITSQIQEQRAAVAGAQATYDQLRQNYNAQVAGGEALVSSAKSAVNNASANVTKEQTTLDSTQIKYDRAVNLEKQGFISVREREDAKTALDTQKNIVQIAVGQLASANSQVDQAQQNLAILKRKGVSDIAASKATLNQAQAAIRLATENQSQGPAYKQNLIALQGQVDATNAQLQQAQSKLADTVVRSTINGIVTARKSDPGALASPGTPILEVQYLDWVFISSTFPIDASAQIHNGQTAQVTIDALPGRKFSGLVTNINPAADPQSRQFGIKVRLENKNHAVRPGMYARVSIVTNKVDAGVVVPKEALLTDSSGNSTVVVVSDGIAHVNPVKIGARDDRGTQIIDGVRAGESVVVLTFNPLKDGQKVKATDLKAESGKKKSGTNSSNATKKPE